MPEHIVLSPSGRKLFVPAKVFPLARRLGCLRRDKSTGLMQITAKIRRFLKPEWDTLAPKLRQILGEDLAGPQYVECHCRPCEKEREEHDTTRMPFGMRPEE